MPDYASQLEQVLRFIDGKPFNKESPVWRKCLEWLANFPPELAPSVKGRLTEVMCRSFETTEKEIAATIADPNFWGLNGIGRPKTREEEYGEEELSRILPRGGWFEWYDVYTRRTESPLSYHVFSSLCVLGAAVGRKCWVDMGFYRLFPNYNAVLIGPPGRVRKTSAVNIAKDFIQAGALCPIAADKITAEALVLNLAKHGGHQFIYAPEFSILFGKQRYNEGLTTLFLRILDCPNEWTTSTVSRGDVTLTNLVPIILGASTLSLLASATPTEVTSSGFLSRFVLVVENDTQRSFPIPEKGSVSLFRQLSEVVQLVKHQEGEIYFSKEGRQFYEEWYRERGKRMRRDYDPTTAEVLERTPDHFLRTAALSHLAVHGDHAMCLQCLQFAGQLLEYVERRIPQTVSTISKTISSQDADYILDALKRLGGASDHSKLLRRVSSRMDAASFKRHIATLAESKLLKQEKRGVTQFYVLLGDE